MTDALKPPARPRKWSYQPNAIDDAGEPIGTKWFISRGKDFVTLRKERTYECVGFSLEAPDGS